MNLFDSLVDRALSQQVELSTLRSVVEKEILHHDILREMSAAGFLKNLTFIGGTCLRYCYGSIRLSEDLDFNGGTDFNRNDLLSFGDNLVHCFLEKYGLKALASEPVKEEGNVDTWKIKVVTRPESPGMPVQRINIDICSLPSHDRRPAMLRNLYQIDMGTSGLILYAESREEILADKIVALALRPNRIKNRDLWDIVWLTRQNIMPSPELISEKLKDRQIAPADFKIRLEERRILLEESYRDYMFEMRRFLPSSVVNQTIEQEGYWDFVLSLIKDICTSAVTA